MPVSLVVGGESEEEFFGVVLSQAHPWADLAATGVEVDLAKGDSAIPALVGVRASQGRSVFVLYDRDALERAHEQAAVLRAAGIEVHELTADFEATFDPVVVQRALRQLNYEADLDCLQDARGSERVFKAIEKCARVAGNTKPLSKVALAVACAQVSARSWYVPAEIFELAIRIGEARGYGSFGGPVGWNEEVLSKIGARGRLYASSHVSNTEVPYWDFDAGSAASIPLPGSFDGRVAICRSGRRFVLRKHHRTTGGLPTSTRIFVVDRGSENSLKLVHEFTMNGSVYEISADEDGNHIELQVQDPRSGSKTAVRCLPDGTQRMAIETSSGDALYAARQAGSRQLVASGPEHLTITDRGQPILSLPHFSALSYVWSPDAKFLSFFGRRWGKRISSQDFHWMLDLTEKDLVHRVAAGESHMPTYWARPEK